MQDLLKPKMVGTGVLIKMTHSQLKKEIEAIIIRYIPMGVKPFKEAVEDCKKEFLTLIDKHTKEELSEKSQQRKWQKRKVAEGKCQACGKPRLGKSAVYCEYHRLKHINEYHVKRNKPLSDIRGKIK